MMDFTVYPIRLVSLRDLRWGDSGLTKADLIEPERRRDYDDVPIWVEQLVSPHFFIHDGRHRVLRAIARGEHEIYAHALMNSMRTRRSPDEAQARPQGHGEAKRTESPVFPL